MNIITLDVETRKGADELPNGWNDKDKMGVACVVIHESHDDKYRVYSQDGIPELIKKLVEADLVIGFNIVNFDFPVMQPHTGFNLQSLLPVFDILKHLEERLGHRVSLDSCAQATLGEKKSADGLQSLKWWKEYEQALKIGANEIAKDKLNRIVQYCKQDVKVTMYLYKFGLQYGFVKYLNKKTGRSNKVMVNFLEPKEGN